MNIPDLVPVSSSMLQAVGYDSENAILYVRFNNGKLYSYADVPSGEFEQMKAAESIGRYLNATIKPNYRAELVAE